MQTAGIHHLGLAVSNLEETAGFFVRCLGWKLVSEVTEYPAKFVSDGTTVFTLWQTDRNATSFDRKSHVGLHHVALKVANDEQLDELFQKVKAYPGVRIEFAPQPMGNGPAKHCMFFEPSGLRMEFVSPG